MRMRKKKNLVPRMERCAAVHVQDGFLLRGNWRSLLPGARELRLELGCGKGRFTVETAAAEPEVLFIAIERVADALVVAMERAVAAGLKNVFFVVGDAAALPEYFEQILAEHGKYSVTREAMGWVFQNNPQLGPELLPGPESRSAFLEHIRTAVDRSRLDLQGERDLDYIIETLMSITGKLLARAIIGQDPASVRREYHDILSILRRGMEKRPGEAARAAEQPSLR